MTDDILTMLARSVRQDPQDIYSCLTSEERAQVTRSTSEVYHSTAEILPVEDQGMDGHRALALEPDERLL